MTRRMVSWCLMVGACSSRSDPEPPPAPAVKPVTTPRDASSDAAVLAPIFAQLEAHSDTYKEPAGDARLVPWRDKDKWGYADREKKIVIAPRFDGARPFAGGRGVVSIGDRCGIVDAAGYEVVPIELVGCSDFVGGVAALAVSGKTLYVDRSGRPINHDQYDQSYRFVGSDGLYPASRGGKVGMIGADGKPRIAPTYHYFVRPSDGAIPVELGDDKWGVVDYTGKQLVPFEYSEIQEFHDGIAFARKGERWGVIDKTNKVIVPFEYGWLLGSTQDEVLAAQKEFEKPPTLVFDHTGKLVATLPLVITESFHEGLGVFEQSKKTGFVTPTGKIVVPARFDSASHFTSGVAWVSINDKYGLVDHTGKPVVPLRYGSAYDYAYMADGDGVLLVRNAAKGTGRQLTFYIDIKGNEYLSPETRAWFAKTAKPDDAQ